MYWECLSIINCIKFTTVGIENHFLKTSLVLGLLNKIMSTLSVSTKFECITTVAITKIESITSSCSLDKESL